MSTHRPKPARSRGNIERKQEHRPTLPGLTGAIAAALIAEADPALRVRDVDPSEAKRAQESRRAARKRVRAVLARDQADAVLDLVSSYSTDILGIERAPAEVRARLIAGAVDGIAIAHAEGITSPLDVLRALRGRRLVAIADAMLDRGQAALDPGLLKGAAYLLDRGLAQLTAAREDARARADGPDVVDDRLALAAERLREYRARRERAEGPNQNVLSGDGSHQGEPTTTPEDASDARGGLGPVPLAEAPARAGLVAASGDPLAAYRAENDAGLEALARADGARAVEELRLEDPRAKRVIGAAARGMLDALNAEVET